MGAAEAVEVKSLWSHTSRQLLCMCERKTQVTHQVDPLTVNSIILKYGSLPADMHSCQGVSVKTARLFHRSPRNQHVIWHDQAGPHPGRGDSFLPLWECTAARCPCSPSQGDTTANMTLVPKPSSFFPIIFFDFVFCLLLTGRLSRWTCGPVVDQERIQQPFTPASSKAPLDGG